MARNQIRRPAQKPKPEPPKPGPLPVIGTLLAIGAISAAGIAWMAPDVRTEDDAVPRATAPVATAATPQPLESAVAATPPPATRPFVDPSGAGTIAYSAGDYEGALAQYRAAIERNPDDAESHSNLGQMLVRLKRIDESIPHFDRAISLIPQRWAYHFNRARAMALLERWDEAIAGYREAQRIFPDDYAIAFNLGQTLHRKGDEAGAVEQYLRAIALDPSDASFRLALGTSYERLQKRVEAAAAYTEYVRQAPSAPDADRVRARIAQLTGAS